MPKKLGTDGLEEDWHRKGETSWEAGTDVQMENDVARGKRQGSESERKTLWTQGRFQKWKRQGWLMSWTVKKREPGFLSPGLWV